MLKKTLDSSRIMNLQRTTWKSQKMTMVTMR